MFRIRSSARRSVTRMPARAEIDVEMAITSGIASPSAWGQAITSTVTTATIPAAGSPTALHTIIATTAANIAR